MVFADWYVPLPPEHLSLIDVERTPPLRFYIWTIDKALTPPEEQMSWGIEYHNGDEILRCQGHTLQATQIYSGVLDPAYKDDFVDLIQYIQAEPAFFTYDEFDGAAPGEMNMPEQYDIAFGASVAGYDYTPGEHANSYAIHNSVQGTPSEGMQHVIDVMRDVFLPEVLNKPL